MTPQLLKFRSSITPGRDGAHKGHHCVCPGPGVVGRWAGPGITFELRLDLVTHQFLKFCSSMFPGPDGAHGGHL